MAIIAKEKEKYIRGLPKVSLKIGGSVRTGYLDKTEGRFYPVDDNDVLVSGEGVAVRPMNTQASEKKRELLNIDIDDDDDETPDSDEDSDDEDSDDKPKKERGGKGKKIGLAIAFIVIAAAALISMIPKGQKPAVQPSPSAIVSEEPPVSSPDVIAEPQKVEVIRLKSAMLPGDVLTPNDVEKFELSEEEYEHGIIEDNNYCHWESLEYISGHYVDHYLPAGHIVEATDVVATSPLTENPWLNHTDGYTTIRLSIDESQADNMLLMWGNRFDLSVRKVTTTEVAVGEPTTSPTPSTTPPTEEPTDEGEEAPDTGVSHTTTVSENTVIVEYVVQDLTICDILNSKGESLYDLYAAYSGIPLSERFSYFTTVISEYANMAETLTPTTIVVKIQESALQEIGSLTASGVSTYVKLREDVNADTEERAAFHADAIEIKTAILSAEAHLEEQLAADEAARQQAAQEALAREEEQKRIEAEQAAKQAENGEGSGNG